MRTCNADPAALAAASLPRAQLTALIALVEEARLFSAQMQAARRSADIAKHDWQNPADRSGWPGRTGQGGGEGGGLRVARRRGEGFAPGVRAGPMKAIRMIHMNSYQAAVARDYGGGDFNDFPERATWREDLDDCGDGLFRFLMVELSEAEDCTSKAVAVQRLQNAVRDITGAIDAVDALPDEKVH